MKLIAKAKPVKFNIEYGGVVHPSLQSIREHFDVSEIINLMDGRFVRWLRLKGEDCLAMQLSDIALSEKSSIGESNGKAEEELLHLLNAIFNKRWNNLLSAYIELSHSNSWVSESYPFISNIIQAIPPEVLFDQAFIFREKGLSSLHKLFIATLKERLEKDIRVISSSEKLVSLSEIWLESVDEHDKAIGKKCLQLAADSGNEKAIETLKRLEITKGLKPYMLPKTVQLDLQRKLKTPALFENSTSSSVIEQQIYAFNSDCRAILRRIIEGNKSGQTDGLFLSEYVQGLFKKAKPNEFLGEEKMFILGLATDNMTYLKKIKDYGPADRAYFFSNINGFYFRAHTLRENIIMLLEHLFEFSAYGR